MIIAKPLQKADGASGITFSYTASKNAPFFRVGITEAGQEKHFDKPIDINKFGLQLSLYDDRENRHSGLLRLVPLDVEGAIPLHNGIKGSVFFKASPWRIPPDTMKAVSVDVLNRSGHELLIAIPPWARAEMK